MTKVLVIGDLHCPADLTRYRSHVVRMQRKHKTTKTVFIGDIVDAHRWGRWDPDHEAPDSQTEYRRTLKRIAWWHDSFPNADVTVGNHDERSVRQARSVGIPDSLIRGYADAWNTPTWNWVPSVTIDGVRYFHGEGFGGKYPHMNAALASGQSTVMGHVHSVAGIQYIARETISYWGMAVGCGVDIRHPAMRYAAKYPSKPVISCAVVIDGTPYLEPMR